MDKESILSTVSHAINITERKNINITGVKKIDSFDNEEFLLETNMGYVVIKGKELEIVKLDELDSYKKAKRQAKKIIRKINKLIKYVKNKGIEDFEDLVEELKEKAEEISEEILTNLE